MTFLELLERNKHPDVQGYYLKLFNLLNNGNNYSFINKIDKVFKYISNIPEQEAIVIKKFSAIIDIETLHDIIVEICVFYHFLDERPIFILEGRAKKTPDIKTLTSYVEIKRLRNSDFQIGLLCDFKGDKYENRLKYENNLNNTDCLHFGVKRKVQEKIDSALLQIGENIGLIYLVYSLDFNRQYFDMKTRRIVFENFCKHYFETIKSTKQVSLKVEYLNDLLYV